MLKVAKDDSCPKQEEWKGSLECTTDPIPLNTLIFLWELGLHALKFFGNYTWLSKPSKFQNTWITIIGYNSSLEVERQSSAMLINFMEKQSMMPRNKKSKIHKEWLTIVVTVHSSFQTFVNKEMSIKFRQKQKSSCCIFWATNVVQKCN